MRIKKSGIIGLVILAIVVVFIVVKLNGNRQKFRNDVAFAQRKIAGVPVAVDTATTGVLSEHVTTSGTLEASEVLNLVSETQGKIVTVYREKGDRVSAGEIIAKVDDEVIAANVLTAEANYALLEKDVERFTRLAEENAIAKRDLEQATIGMKKAKADLINARKALANTSIKAPISGYINNDFITTGQFLSGGSSVCEIVNNNQLKLNIRVTEQEVFKLKTGQAVNIKVTAFPDRKFTGHITSIAEKSDAAMKFNVEITLINDANIHLKSGLYAQAELPVKNTEQIIIPKSGIVGSMENPVVYIAENGKAVKRQLITGHSNNSEVEVLQGLSSGDLVIVSGQLNLKDGDDINIVR